MHLALFGAWEATLAIGLVALGAATALILVLGFLRRFKLMLALAGLALMLAIVAGVTAWNQGDPPPVLLHDIVILIDNSRSMSEIDEFHDPESVQCVKALADEFCAQAGVDLPAGWRPNRLQLVQAALTRENPAWLKALVWSQRARIHFFHLDEKGRAAKVQGAAILDAGDRSQFVQASVAIRSLTPNAGDTRLDAVLAEVLEQSNDLKLAGVILCTDGVRARDGALAEAASKAAAKGVPVSIFCPGDGFGSGLLQLNGLQMDDSAHVGDRVVIEANLSWIGASEMDAPVSLKVREKDGAERTLQREIIKLGPCDRRRVRFTDQPDEAGPRHYVLEGESPGKSVTRLERTIDILPSQPLKVLYIEAQPRYEFRFLSGFLQRNNKGDKKQPVQMIVMILDADSDWGDNLRSIANMPESLEALRKFDAIILGDCDAEHKKLREHLDNIASFVRGEPGKERGRGILFIAGPQSNPHRYGGTPLAPLLPVIPLDKAPPQDVPRQDPYRPALTASGRTHPIFRFSADEKGKQEIWERLQPMFWHSSGYAVKPAADVLAVHPHERIAGKGQANDDRLPLVVEQPVGGGRSLFFGFDETWRWRFREDDATYDAFWLRTLRHLCSFPAASLRLQQSKHKRVGEPIKLQVRLSQAAGGKVVVSATRQLEAGKSAPPQEIILAEAGGRPGTYVGEFRPEHRGRYVLRLEKPDVGAWPPDRPPPRAEVQVEPALTEKERLRINYPDLVDAAASARGMIFTPTTIDQLPGQLPRKAR